MSLIEGVQRSVLDLEGPLHVVELGPDLRRRVDVVDSGITSPWVTFAVLFAQRVVVEVCSREEGQPAPGVHDDAVGPVAQLEIAVLVQAKDVVAAYGDLG